MFIRLPFGGPRVALVGRDQSWLAQLEMVLKRRGYRVSVLAMPPSRPNVPRLIALLARFDPAVVVYDLMAPADQYLRLLETVRQHDLRSDRRYLVTADPLVLRLESAGSELLPRQDAAGGVSEQLLAAVAEAVRRRA